MTRHLLDEVLDARQQREDEMLATALAGRVRKGARLLDERMPGWWRQIDLERLDIDSPCDCVAGQVGGYTEVLRALGLDDGAEYDYGFDGGSFAEVRALTLAWCELITARRAAAQVPA